MQFSHKHEAFLMYVKMKELINIFQGNKKRN